MTEKAVDGGETEARKRKREKPCWWEGTCKWITSKDTAIKGGVVAIHDALRWNTDTRTLSVARPIKSGTTVMEIPSTCLVCISNIKARMGGASVVGEIMQPENYKWKSGSAEDVLLALFLTTRAATDSDFVHYFNTLPHEDDNESPRLPRFWKEEELKLLEGSSLLDRIEANRLAVEHDADQLVRMNHLDSKQRHQWSRMLANVTSRAFHGMGDSVVGVDAPNEAIAMIPLLDLCNHHRGSGTVRKNLSYTKEIVNSSSTTSVIRVKACQDIGGGEALRITYGAQGNGPLLLNYGFCLLENIEPDGSSNDVVELKLKKDDHNDDEAKEEHILNLRTGPKSYTYGPFTDALSHCYERKESDRSGDAGSAFDDDGQEIGRLGEEDDDLFEMMMNDCMGGGDDGDDDDEEMDDEEEDDEKKQQLQLDLQACKTLQAVLDEAYKHTYPNMSDAVIQATRNDEQLPNHNTAILLHTEKRTIQFYHCAAFKLEQWISSRNLLEEQQLLKGDESEEPTKRTFPWSYLIDDQERLEGQADELVETYVRIRYPDLTQPID